MLEKIIYKLKRPFHLIKTGLLRGAVSQWQYGFPTKKLNVIAITGTDGKTTSATMLYHIMKKAGLKVALLTTVAAYIEDKEIDTGFHVTSPSPKDLFEFTKDMVDQDINYLVLEATSHGIYQYRTWGIRPLIAGVTNISHEHLDYHVTYQNYLEAKAEILKKSRLAVINEDDQSFALLKKILTKKKTPNIAYGESRPLPKTIKTAINKYIYQDYNKANARLASTIALNIPTPITQKVIAQALKDFPGVKGRMEEVVSKPFKVIVDFAHTPQALEAALTALGEKLNNQRRKGRLIAVYGSAGLRDSLKRPLMGKIGADLADIAIFTAEDPRTENIWSIIRQMKEQLTEGHSKILSIANRREAIEFALTRLAQPGDIIGIFGKGHEQSMCYGTVEYPWSDQEAVKEIMGQK